MATASARWRRVGSVLLCVLGLAVGGCGGGGPKRYSVSGEVKLDGEPLSGGVLHFYPDPARGNQHRIDCLSPVRSGKYDLLTQAVRDSETGKGAPAGWYKVYLYTDIPGVTVKIHERFTDPNKTPVSVEVVEDPAPGAYDIKFTSK